MFDTNLYQPILLMNSKGVFGEISAEIPLEELRSFKDPVLNAFLDDNDYQQITLCSTNLGVVRTVKKKFK